MSAAKACQGHSFLVCLSPKGRHRVFEHLDLSLPACLCRPDRMECQKVNYCYHITVDAAYCVCSLRSNMEHKLLQPCIGGYTGHSLDGTFRSSHRCSL